MSWSARQYVTFEDERTRPVRDLLAAVPTASAQGAVDMGCGPGNSTAALIERFPEAQVSGFDSSADMIQAARERLPQIEFEIADIESWNAPGTFDVLLANALLQWVPNHAQLLPALIAKLNAGGSLAIQMPDNLDEPAHRLMRAVASEPSWSQKLAAAASQRTVMESAQWYYRLLRPLCTRVDIWRTTYHHPLSGGVQAVIEWFKGSGLRPYLDALNADERTEYLRRYAGLIEQAYPPFADGTVLLPFPRLFIVATR